MGNASEKGERKRSHFSLQCQQSTSERRKKLRCSPSLLLLLSPLYFSVCFVCLCVCVYVLFLVGVGGRGVIRGVGAPGPAPRRAPRRRGPRAPPQRPPARTSRAFSSLSLVSSFPTHLISSTSQPDHSALSARCKPKKALPRSPPPLDLHLHGRAAIGVPLREEGSK